MAEILQYNSKSFALGNAVTDSEVPIPHKVVHVFVPKAVAASIKFGSRDADSIPLSAGLQRFCFEEPPGKAYLTASKGDPVRFFTAQGIVEDFFGGDGDFFNVVEWELECFWPPHVHQITDGDLTIELDAHPIRGAVETHRVFIGNGLGAGQNRMRMIDEILGLELEHTVGDRTRELGVNIDIVGPLETRPAVAPMETRRVYWDSYMIALPGTQPNARFETGIQYFPFAGAGGGWITGNNPAYGLFHDGTSAWEWVENRTGVPPDFAQTITWPRALTEPTRVDVVHFMATPDRNAKVQLWVDRALQLERTWEAGTTLPGYAQVFNAATVTRLMRANTNGVRFWIGDVAFRSGRYDLQRQLVES